jgi:hypothetical protein
MPLRLLSKKGINQLARIPKNLINFYQGRLDSGSPILDGFRDFAAKTSYSLTSHYLKKLSSKNLEYIVLNTCHLSPILPSISHWADWSLHRQGFNGNLKIQPRMVFVKADLLFRFYHDYLPLIRPDSRFVLVTGDSDLTIPIQVDKRFAKNTEGQLSMLLSLHDDPRVLRWYAQNVDTALPKLEPIPLGYWEPEGTRILKAAFRQERPMSLWSKPLKAFCANRIRTGEQWEARRIVEAKALNEWVGHVDYFHSVPPDKFFSVISGYPFVMCVGGGGLDPSPKAWTSLMAGAIPIIEKNATTLAYTDLPVVFIDSWSKLELNSEVMMKWISEREKFFSNPQLRQQVLKSLSMGHWLKKILPTTS